MNYLDPVSAQLTSETIVRMTLVAWSDIDTPSTADVADVVGRLCEAFAPGMLNVPAIAAEVCRRRGV